MLKPNAVLSRILSLLLLPPSAAAFCSAQLMRGSVAPVAAVAAIEDGDNTNHSDRSAHRDKSVDDSITIRTPREGQVITTSPLKVRLTLGRKLDRKTLRVVFNGKDVTSRFTTPHEDDDDGKASATLTSSDGLRKGENRLRVHAHSADGHVMERVRFYYSAGLQAGQDRPSWLPPSIGLSLNPGGAQPWVTLTTGWPADMQDSIDPTKYQVPYRDATFPIASDTPCTGRYQVLVLNRATPAQEDGYLCATSAADLKTKLTALPKSTELVLVGTTLNNNADAGLDTTAIGGTDYSAYPAKFQPQGYAAIGVPGAAVGSAYESYYVPADLGTAYWRPPFADGILAQDGANYNFHAGHDIQFEVYPNNPNTDNSNVYVADGSVVHGWGPPAGSANGFWLLVLDRVTLLPIDASTASGSPCQPSGFAQNCGQFFPTGNTDLNIALQAMNDLVVAFNQGTSRQLMVLTTYGQPFQSGADPASLEFWLSWAGGAGRILSSLTTPTSSYTLITPGPWLPTPPFFPGPVKSPFTRGVVNSSTAFSQQGQTGIVRGVMARDNDSLYFLSVVSQEDGKGNAQDATNLSIDYDFYTISTQTPIDWPLTDTPGHLAAYHWASNAFLNRHNIESGGLSADLRYWYPGSEATVIENNNTDFQCPNTITNSPCQFPGDDFGFTEQDLADVNAELYKETTALLDSDLYFGSQGIGGLLGNGSSSLADQVIGVTYEALNNQVMPVTTTTSASMSSYDWMNLLAGVTSVAAAAFGPLDLPVAAAGMGVLSGTLWTGSAFAPWAPTDAATPPNYESSYNVTLGTLAGQASTYQQNLINSYAVSLDNVYSDWGKLSATGAKTSDSDNGWYLANQSVALLMEQKFNDAMRRNMYVQLVPQFYQLDTYVQQPVPTLDKIGMFYAKAGENWCNSSYSTTVLNNDSLYRVYPSDTKAGTTDMFVLGGQIANQGTKDVFESFPSDSLQSILWGTDPGDLNIPQGLVYGTYWLTWRTGGPNQGTYGGQDAPSGGFSQCYNPGCRDFTNDPSWSSCIAPAN